MKELLTKPNLAALSVFLVSCALGVFFALLLDDTLQAKTDDSFNRSKLALQIELQTLHRDVGFVMSNAASQFIPDEEVIADYGARPREPLAVISPSRFSSVVAASVAFTPFTSVFVWMPHVTDNATRLLWEKDVLARFPEAELQSFGYMSANGKIPYPYNIPDDEAHFFPLVYAERMSIPNRLVLASFYEIPERRLVMDEAARSGLPASMPPVTLISTGDVGLVAYAPAIKPDSTVTKAADRGLLGFISCAFRIRTGLASALDVVLTNSPELFVSITDIGPTFSTNTTTHERKFLLSLGKGSPSNISLDKGTSQPKSRFGAHRKDTFHMTFLQRQWEVVVIEVDPLLSFQVAMLPWIILIAIVTFGFCLALFGKSWSVWSESNRRALQQTIKSLHDFVASATHDIRTPLNAFELSMQILLETKLTTEQRALVNDALAARHFMQQVIDNAITLERIYSTADPIPTIERVDLKNLATTVARVLLSNWTSGGDSEVKVRCHFALIHTEPPSDCEVADLTADLPNIDDTMDVLCDAKWIQQIITNFGTNALKFTQSGAVDIFIAVYTKQKSVDTAKPGSLRRRSSLSDKQAELLTEGKHTLRIEVQDSGRGVPPEKREQLFQRFSQLQSDAGGLGLGLFSVNMLTRALGGRCGVGERKDGKSGAVFWSQFPTNLALQSPLPRPSATDTSASLCSSEASEDTAREVVKPLVALVADDIAMNRRLLARFLKTMNVESILVNDGDQLVRAFESHLRAREDIEVRHSPTSSKAASEVEMHEFDSSPLPLPTEYIDLVITDVQMPICDGFEATRRLRKLEQSALRIPCGGEDKPIHIPVFGFTASQSRDMEGQCLEAGMDGVLFKPFKREQFEQSLQSVGLR